MTETTKSIIDKLQLKPHPEGGYFRETYRSEGSIDEQNLGDNYEGERSFSTCIYFLLTSDRFSAFHKIKQDEIWHFYDGSPIRLHIISEAGKYGYHIIGRNLDKEEVPQLVVSGGSWFAAEVINEDDYSLVGCTVAPGFSFDDFELKNRKDLTELFPDKEKIISKLTHN